MAVCNNNRAYISPSALHFVPHCLQLALSLRPKLGFDPEKMINSTFFAAESKNIFEFISNLENFGNPEFFFPDYWVFFWKWTLYLDFAGHNTPIFQKSFFILGIKKKNYVCYDNFMIFLISCTEYWRQREFSGSTKYYLSYFSYWHKFQVFMLVRKFWTCSWLF